jgi:hypothetical protein
MSQAASFGVPSGPPATPTQMAFRINASFAALLSMNSGETEPAYKEKGTLWLDLSASPHPVKLYGGAGWATLGTLDPDTSVFEFNIDTDLEIGDIEGLTDALAAKVPTSRTVSAGGLATGGGSLAENRTITVTGASQGQAEAGTDNATVMTPLRTAQAIAALAASSVPSATTDTQGKVELATTAETQALSDTARAVTPAGLAGIGVPDEPYAVISTASGSTQSLTNIPKSRAILAVWAGVSATGTAIMRVAISDNNGSTYGTPREVGSSVGSTFENQIQAWITGTGLTATNKRIHYIMGGSAGGNAALGTEVENVRTGITNALRFSPSAGSFDAGNIYVYLWR